MRRLEAHWPLAAFGVTLILGGITIAGGTSVGAGWATGVVGLFLVLVSFSKGQPSGLSINGPKPNVFIEYQVDLDNAPTAEMIVRNDGDVTAHNIQISTIEYGGRALKFERMLILDPRSKRPATTAVYETNGQISVVWGDNIKRFLEQPTKEQNIRRLFDDTKAGRPASMYRPLRLPFWVSFRAMGQRPLKRRQVLHYDPASHHAYVEPIHSSPG